MVVVVAIVVAGVIAGTDTKAGGGVHKAPANEPVLGVAELVTSVSDREQAALIQENLAQSSFDRGFMKSFKEAFEKNQEKGINTAKECIEQQLK